MDELQLETGPVNPYARTFFWLWGAALLALAGFRAINPTDVHAASAVNAVRQSVQQPGAGAGTFRNSFSLVNQATTYYVPFQRPLN
jgi:hypothetical protein